MHDESAMIANNRTSGMRTTETRRAEVFVAHELLHRCLGKVDFALSILDRFLARLESDTEELRQAARAEDAEQISHVAHRLKGSAANVAAWRIHGVLTSMETLVHNDRLSEMSAAIEELEREISAFERAQAGWRSHAN
jgi:HPt (histidine-containing phosphotransfer) domain-containing protein